MQNLNRFCKYPDSSLQTRDLLYGLKNQFLRLLYTQGYCIEVIRHGLYQPARECFACDGSGIYIGHCSSASGECDRCDGTGEYLPARTLWFVAFRYEVAGEVFSWHQPERFIDYHITPTGPDCPLPKWEHKPMDVPTTALPRLRALVEWVLAVMPPVAANAPAPNEAAS